MAELYVVREEAVIVVSRRRVRARGRSPVARPWQALVELPVPVPVAASARPIADTALVFLPPAAVAALVAAFAPAGIGIAAGGAALIATTALAPALRRRLAELLRRPRFVGAGRVGARRVGARRTRAGPTVAKSHLRTGAESHLRTGAESHLRTGAESYRLAGADERAAFNRAIGAADRISATWPSLGSLIDVAEAESLLAEALWEIAGVLARRQELSAVLSDLNRPEFAASAPFDETAAEVRAHVEAAQAARAELNAELSRRAAALHRAEEAGRDFLREQDMRRAVRAAENSLRTARPHPPASPDAATELAEHTRSVLAAYRELTVGFRPPPSLR